MIPHPSKVMPVDHIATCDDADEKTICVVYAFIQRISLGMADNFKYFNRVIFTARLHEPNLFIHQLEL